LELFGGELATIGDLDIFLRSVIRSSAALLNVTHYIFAAKHTAENDVLTIEMRRRHSRDKKLRAICVRSSIGH
jgi:hypothetical protein